MKEIPVKQYGKVTYLAKVDDDTYDRLSHYSWTIAAHGYAKASIKRNGKFTTTTMHRMVLGSPPSIGKIVDHINRDKTDNRKCNLRWATPAQNNANQTALRTSSTGIRGVHPAKAGKWCAQICVSYKIKRIGLFLTKEEAEQAYKKAAIEAYGEFASCYGQ